MSLSSVMREDQVEARVLAFVPRRLAQAQAQTSGKTTLAMLQTMAEQAAHEQAWPMVAV